jgi:BASS family bile acid:Na+ symporter
MTRRFSKIYPLVGVAATLCLVGGGAANSAKISFGFRATLASILLPVLGGFVASLIARGLPERSKRTLVIEVLSKSPTLAYVLALKHFDAAAAAVPAAGMVSLAVVGALVASGWKFLDTLDDGR